MYTRVPLDTIQSKTSSGWGVHETYASGGTSGSLLPSPIATFGGSAARYTRRPAGATPGIVAGSGNARPTEGGSDARAGARVSTLEQSADARELGAGDLRCELQRRGRAGRGRARRRCVDLLRRLGAQWNAIGGATPQEAAPLPIAVERAAVTTKRASPRARKIGR
jgi:hypothetical protein